MGADAMTQPSRLVAVSLVLGAMLCALVAEAQNIRSPIFIRQRIEQSLELQRQALAAGDDVEQALKLSWDAYVLLRAAHSDMIINASNMKFPDPLFPLADKRLERARAHILQAREVLKSPGAFSPQAFQEAFRSNLGTAVQL